MNKIYFIDICTLFDEHYTGIANVNYHILQYFFKNFQNDSEFFYHQKVIEKKVIEELLHKKKGGAWIKKISGENKLYKGEIKEFTKEVCSIGIFSHAKYVRNIFDYEIQIIHDITYILTKEFHHQDTTDYHLRFALKDFASNNLNVCNSQATMDDIVTYMGVDKEKTIVSLLGIDDNNKELYDNIVNNYDVENYILIIGTIEPRKNIDIILKYIECRPDILKKYKFVFIGKNGWGEHCDEKIKKLNIDNSLKNNILHLGFVSDDMKNTMLKAASFLIYPSIYEGFGLPVIEALSFGTPVLTTISSSIPEVGGDVCYYFDPYSLEDFSKSFEQIDHDLKNNRIDKDRLLHHASLYNWDSFVENFLKRAHKDLGFIDI